MATTLFRETLGTKNCACTTGYPRTGHCWCGQCFCGNAWCSTKNCWIYGTMAVGSYELPNLSTKNTESIITLWDIHHFELGEWPSNAINHGTPAPALVVQCELLRHTFLGSLMAVLVLSSAWLRKPPQLHSSSPKYVYTPPMTDPWGLVR